MKKENNEISEPVIWTTLSEKSRQKANDAFNRNLTDLVSTFDFARASEIMSTYDMGWAIYTMPDYCEAGEDFIPCHGKKDCGIPRPHIIAANAVDQFRQAWNKITAKGKIIRLRKGEDSPEPERYYYLEKTWGTGRFEFFIGLYYYPDTEKIDVFLELKFIPIDSCYE